MKNTKSKKRNSPSEVTNIIAEICDCTPSYVRKILNGVREENSERAKAVRAAYDNYMDQKNELLKSVKRLVNF